ncbi:hypothetical protein HYPGJ_20259 [Hyphomicrobium sp. GJ21]|nr:hypothetical protein HYPGJ_20259 [Hyphomicrobium sp. GJ21]
MRARPYAVLKKISMHINMRQHMPRLLKIKRGIVTGSIQGFRREHSNASHSRVQPFGEQSSSPPEVIPTIEIPQTLHCLATTFDFQIEF